jgi:acyl-CoA thioester hydrolase
MTTESSLKPIASPANAEDLAPNTAFWCSMRVDPGAVSRSVPHVNNAEYLKWVDRAAELAVDAQGFTREKLIAEKRMWFVVRHELNYRAECFVDDELLIATWVQEYSRTTSLRNTLVYRPRDDKSVLDASTRWVFVDLETRRPTRIPMEVRNLFPPPDLQQVQAE